MGVLDELKKEAASVKAQQEQSRTSEQARREAVLKKIRPRMQQTYSYLKELADNLNVVKPEVWVNYDIEGFGALKGLRQEAYRLTTPDNRTLTQFTLHYTCASEGGVRFQVKGKEAAERQRQVMWRYNLRFTSKQLSDGTGVFYLETYVPVSFEFESEPERGAIRLRVRNLDVLGTTTTYYDPDQLTTEFLDELGKAVLHKPNRFNELSGNQLSQEARKRLRQQLAHDGYKRLSEVKREHPEQPPADDADRGSRRKGLLKGLLRR